MASQGSPPPAAAHPVPPAADALARTASAPAAPPSGPFTLLDVRTSPVPLKLTWWAALRASAVVVGGLAMAGRCGGYTQGWMIAVSACASMCCHCCCRRCGRRCNAQHRTRCIPRDLFLSLPPTLPPTPRLPRLTPCFRARDAVYPAAICLRKDLRVLSLVK